MATTTTNFGWDIPQSTDLVKDGATAIAALGQDIDTALVDLKGGTTGQVLSKASNTDLDFTWATDASGIPATIFDAKGDLIAASAADTAARLAVGTNNQQLLADSSTATGLKWGASPTSVLTTTGDLLYASAANTLARRGIGSDGQVLTVSSGVPNWTTISAGWTASYSSFSPEISQSSGNTNIRGFNSVKYSEQGNWVHMAGQCLINAAGTSNTAIRVTLPVTVDTANIGYYPIGLVYHYDTSAGTYYIGTAVLNSSTTFNIWSGINKTNGRWGLSTSDYNFALSSGDEFNFDLMIRVA